MPRQDLHLGGSSDGGSPTLAPWGPPGGFQGLMPRPDENLGETREEGVGRPSRASNLLGVQGKIISHGRRQTKKKIVDFLRHLITASPSPTSNAYPGSPTS